jgi:hypothetical protein
MHDRILLTSHVIPAFLVTGSSPWLSMLVNDRLELLVLLLKD